MRILRNPSSARLAAILAVLLALPAARGGAGQPAGAPPAAVPRAVPVALPGGEGGIGFDDLGFAAPLGKLLVPAGRSGHLDLIDPATRQVTAIAGFSAQGGFARGHGEGTTSADFGRGLIFATDRTAKQLVVIDPATGTVAARAEGKAVTLDLAQGGAVRDALSAGAGVDIIDYNPRLGHLYLPGATSQTMAIVGVSRLGRLSLLATVKTAAAAHCVVADDHHQAWICDPGRGRLLVVDDTLPASE